MVQPGANRSSRNWFELGHAVVGGGRQPELAMGGVVRHAVQGQLLQTIAKIAPKFAQLTFIVIVAGVMTVSGLHE